MNDDGTWLRLSMESVKEFCYNPLAEAWCMQYNQHLGRTLLFPISGAADVTAAAATPESVKSTRKNRYREKGGNVKVFESAQTYYVVDCGASGHNVRAQPHLKALAVGKLKLGSCLLVTEQVRPPSSYSAIYFNFIDQINQING